jgi:peptidoglycan/xylan/chitin deacetylase (PgdA/CDA1 family)
VLCYHNVVGPDARGLGDPGTHMGVEDFSRHMEWLAKCYRVLSLEELLSLPRGKPVRGAAAITFDDGYTGVFEHALPVLEALSLPATLFVVAGAPDSGAGFWWDDPAIVSLATPQRRVHWLGDLAGDSVRIRAEQAAAADRRHIELVPASWDRIREAARHPLFSFGAHSVTHRALAALDRDALVYELAASRDILSHQLGSAPDFFAYPYGSWNREVHDAARAAGYSAALTLDDRPFSSADTRWAIPRVCIPANLPINGLVSWLVNVRPSP